MSRIGPSGHSDALLRMSALRSRGHEAALPVPGAVYRPIERMRRDLPPELHQAVMDAICEVADKDHAIQVRDPPAALGDEPH
jgi:hypothetical protein